MEAIGSSPSIGEFPILIDSRVGRVDEDKVIFVLSGKGLDDFPVFSCDGIFAEDLPIGGDDGVEQTEVILGRISGLMELSEALNVI